MLTEKRRQHHVWRRYLESWCIDGRLYCFRDGEVFPNAPHNLAVESYFYRLDDLTESDLALYRKLLIEKGDAYQKKSHERFLSMVMAPIEMAERVKQVENNPTLYPVLQEFLKTYKTNVLEDYYAGIESEFGPILGKLLSGDLSVFSNDETVIPLYYFLATQYMRTKRIRESWIKSFEEAPFSIERILPLLALQYAENIGRSLYLDRKKISPVILDNPTEIAFITGDQPIINLLAVADRPATELSLYYPLSPTKALLLSDAGRHAMVTNDSFNKEWAVELNRKIAENSHSQVFARDACALKLFVNMKTI
ncbi:DUF4238 domain-containing protein [Nitrobacter sp.]|uniref:DUF4238 domain-containing protein n=1 Tax=Nitrobacter sp. TaxID=29420 RepID=UPI003F649DEB